MKRPFAWLVVLSLLLTACEFSLAGDITPPADAIIAGEATLAPIAAPVSAPDRAAGAEIYANRCAPCHGVTGLGDGEQAAQLPFFPSAIGEPDLARAASPENWFRIISAGCQTRYMPPFGSVLTEQQRWDVLAYVYGLGWGAETLARGAQIYDEHHDEIDNLLSEFPPIAIDQDSIEALQLPANDADALTAYLQAEALRIESLSETVREISTAPADESAIVLGRFTGQVTYGTGGQIPNGLEARLYGFDHTDQIVSETVPVSSNGSFAFDDVPVKNGRIFFVQVDYKELSFFSEFLTVDGQEGTYGLDVPIYDSTSDISDLAVEKVQLIFDFPRAGLVQVVESVTISNLGDRAVAPDDGIPVLHFSLPANASNLSFEEGELGERYLPDESGFGDMRAVMPGVGSYSLLFAYEMPYESSLSFPFLIELPTRSVAAFVPVDGIQVQGDEFKLNGNQDINGASYALFSSGKGYFPDDEVTIALSGRHPLGGNSLLQDDSLLVGLLALTAAVGFAWLWLRRLPATEPSGTDRILAGIVALDARYEKGKLPKTSYSKKRSALKARLRRELGKQK